MHQIWWIFRKDVRRLWPQIAVTLALQCAYVVFRLRSSPLPLQQFEKANILAAILASFLVLAWFYLIALLVQEEALPGTRQFWLTRPYRWHNLLGAKLLFCFAFINLPLFFADCSILTLEGFPIGSNLPGILLRQLPLTVYFVVPALLLAVITENVAQLLFACFLAVLTWVAEIAFFSASHNGAAVAINTVSAGSQWLGGWIMLVLLLAIALAAIIWQYRRRRTLPLRVALAVFVACVVFLPDLTRHLSPTITLITRRTPAQITTSGIHLAYSSSAAGNFSAPPAYVGVELPLTVTGLPPNVDLEGFGSFPCQLPARDEQHCGTSIQHRQDGFWQTFLVPATQAKSLARRATVFRSSLRLTVFTSGIAAALPFDRNSRAVLPDVGYCLPEPSLLGIQCFSGVWEAQRTGLRLASPGSRFATALAGSSFDDPFPLITGLSPVNKTFTTFSSNGKAISSDWATPGARLTFAPERPLGSFSRTLETPSMQIPVPSPGATP